jgi:hypothetical protein
MLLAGRKLREDKDREGVPDHVGTRSCGDGHSCPSMPSNARPAFLCCGTNRDAGNHASSCCLSADFDCVPDPTIPSPGVSRIFIDALPSTSHLTCTVKPYILKEVNSFRCFSFFRGPRQGTGRATASSAQYHLAVTRRKHHEYAAFELSPQRPKAAVGRR